MHGQQRTGKRTEGSDIVLHLLIFPLRILNPILRNKWLTHTYISAVPGKLSSTKEDNSKNVIARFGYL